MTPQLNSVTVLVWRLYKFEPPSDCPIKRNKLSTLCHYIAMHFEHKEMGLPVSFCFSLLRLKVQMQTAHGLLCQKYTK